MAEVPGPAARAQGLTSTAVYTWLWRKLPGGIPGKVAALLAMFLIITIVLFMWVFPWLEPRLPFNHVTVDQ